MSSCLKRLLNSSPSKTWTPSSGTSSRNSPPAPSSTGFTSALNKASSGSQSKTICLIAFYNEKTVIVKQLCCMDIIPEYELAIPLQSKNFLVYTRRTLGTNLSYPNKELEDYTIPKGISQSSYTIRLSPDPGSEHYLLPVHSPDVSKHEILWAGRSHYPRIFDYIRHQDIVISAAAGAFACFVIIGIRWNPLHDASTLERSHNWCWSGLNQRLHAWQIQGHRLRLDLIQGSIAIVLADTEPKK